MWAVLAGGQSQASTITITNDLIGTNPGLWVGTLTGAATFVGFTGVNTFSPTDATAIYLGNQSDATEIAKLNELLNSPGLYTSATFVKDENPTNSFDVFGLYFSLTINGPNAGTAYFRNDSPGAGLISLTYTQAPDGYGLSHVSMYAVPGPLLGAGLPGLLMAAGGLVLLARRRRGRSLA
jgi:hypothetical protein